MHAPNTSVRPDHPLDLDHLVISKLGRSWICGEDLQKSEQFEYHSVKTTKADVSWKHQMPQGSQVPPLHTEPGYHLAIVVDPSFCAERQHKCLPSRYLDSGSMVVVL